MINRYLNYVKEQIKEKDKIKVYETWRARYVYQTTGPFSFNRFIKNNKIIVEKYIINEPLTYDDSLNLKGDEDFISYPSCSYL